MQSLGAARAIRSQTCTDREEVIRVFILDLSRPRHTSGYPEGFRSVVVIAKVGASRDETKTQARKSSHNLKLYDELM